MGKVLTDAEVLSIVQGAITGDNGHIIDDSAEYIYFLEGLGDLITKSFGGTCIDVKHSPEYENSAYLIEFEVNEFVPRDGGVFKQFAKNVIWVEGIEI